jgi:Phosphodiester glycosidase
MTGASRVAAAIVLLAFCCASFAYARFGLYGFNAFRLRGGSMWISVPADSPVLPRAMRMALYDPPPIVRAGDLVWTKIADGLDAGELPVLAGAEEVDRILLARVDPTRFRFEVRSAAAGTMLLDDWMAEPGTVLVINGSYYGPDGRPDTPVVSSGVRLGPTRYVAEHGAFIASDGFTGVRDLGLGNLAAAFAGAHDAMVSYPLLIAPDGSSRVAADRGWLANRSFIGQDTQGRIILGTTKSAFFTLSRLGDLLRAAPLALTIALNLDGGPVACQGISPGGFTRRFCGRWEYAFHDGEGQLLTWRWGRHGRWALPLVLAVVRK